MEIQFDIIDNVRLDQYLFDYFFDKDLFDFSRNQIQILIKEEKVQVNNKVIKKSGFLLNGKGIIIIDILRNSNSDKLVKWKNWSLIDVIYENSDYIVINKPANLSVHPGSGNYDNTLVNLLLAKYKNLSNINTLKPGIVHRIDKNTTGIIIITKTDEMFNFLQNQFINREVKKTYIGLVVGHLKNKSGEIRLPLARGKADKRKITINPKGKESITIFNVIERFKDFDLVKFNILTGRTHQIRVHSKYLKAPIYNDYLYGKKEYLDSNIGQFLHSKSIEFKDLNNNWVKYEAELPSYFKDKLKELREENKNDKN